MDLASISPYIRSSNPIISRWQSAVTETIKQSIDQNDLIQTLRAVEEHPMVKGMNLFAAKMNGQDIDTSKERIQSLDNEQERKKDVLPLIHAHIAERMVKLSDSTNPSSMLATVNVKDISSLAKEIEPKYFPDSDYAYEKWIDAGMIFAKSDRYPSPYINVDDHGGSKSNFSVYTIPANSKLAILGDFGTGLDDATSMLIAILEQIQPDFIIHLGDIYYSGTKEECQTYCQVFQKAFEVANMTVPVFSLPGNHDYMADGKGFFGQVLKLNSNTNAKGNYRQEASYFSLRTEDGNWQFLGMDTGLNSLCVHTWELMITYSPWLEFSEAEWHKHKLETWNGKNVLLSHHQLFSAYDKINDGKNVHYQRSGPPKEEMAFLNMNLQRVFQPYQDSINAWFWGHEHNLCILEDNQAGLKKGRLVGGSGFEELGKEIPAGASANGSPYKNRDIRVDSTSVEWEGDNFEFLNHSFAVVSLDGNNAVADYYQYPITAITRGFKNLDVKECQHLYHEAL